MKSINELIREHDEQFGTNLRLESLRINEFDLLEMLKNRKGRKIIVAESEKETVFDGQFLKYA